MPRYTLCPYYIDENNKAISCEDVCRTYDSMKQKWAWMDMYCDSWDWMKCPYAMDRAEAYHNYEKGDIKALDEQKEKAMKVEIKSLTSKLGRVNKKYERLEKKLTEKEELVKSYQRKNEELYKKWRDIDNTLKAYEKNIASQIQQLADAYESRLAYMMDMFSDGTLNESDVKDWLKDKQFAIVATDYGYEVRFSEEENEDGVEKIEEQVQE